MAVAGKFREIAVKSNHTIRYLNVLHFYNDIGQMVYKVDIPCETVSSPALFRNMGFALTEMFQRNPSKCKKPLVYSKFLSFLLAQIFK